MTVDQVRTALRGRVAGGAGPGAATRLERSRAGSRRVQGVRVLLGRVRTRPPAARAR
jgi:hypothetical protein